MFKGTRYFNPTGFRRTTLPSYALATPQQTANRFTLAYVPSYVPPPPAPEPAPVVDTGGGGDNNISGPGSYQIGNTGTFKQMNYNDHHSSGIHDGGGGSYDNFGNDTSDGWGGGWGGDGGWSHGGTIPPMYAQTGSFVDGVKQTDLDLGTAMALAKDKASGVLGTITGQEKESFLAGKTASELGFTNQMLDAISKPEAIAGAILGLPPGSTTLAKEIGVPMYNAYIDFVNTYSDQGIANAALEADIAKTLSAPVGIAEQTAVEEKDVGDYSIDDSISIALPSLYDKYSMAAQKELDTAVPSQPPGIGPGPATPSGIPDMGITPATSSSELSSVHGVSPDIDAAINDIANEIDSPTTSSPPSTTSSPPSTTSDHANVHGSDPSPPNSQPPGIDPGPATPSYGSGMQDDGDFSSGNTSGSTSMGPGSGMSGPGDMGGGMQGGADDPAGAGAGMGGPGAGTWSKGGYIYASKGGYVNSTGGK